MPSVVGKAYIGPDRPPFAMTNERMFKSHRQSIDGVSRLSRTMRAVLHGRKVQPINRRASPEELYEKHMMTDTEAQTGEFERAATSILELLRQGALFTGRQENTLVDTIHDLKMGYGEWLRQTPQKEQSYLPDV